MNAVFADTFYFLALVSRKDKSHRKCLEFSQTSTRPVLTTTWVLLELGSALRRVHDREVFSTFVKVLADDPDTIVLPADQQVFDQAVALFRERPDKEWSLTDCTSFVVMKEQGLTEALTSDHHFQQAGFTALLA
jgi:predicted nucleic acid-binding protein